MRKMKILLSAGANPQFYIEAIKGVGAEPVLKYLQKIDIDYYDGLILCGGNDIDPEYYNEDVVGAVSVDRERDTAEFSLLKAFVEAGKPILGICRGHQLINIFFGGSLYQHLPESEIHKGVNDTDAIHHIEAVESSILRKLYGESFSVNSSHHQAVNILGENLRATAHWNNQYIEALEHTFLPVFGVQWHPERMCFSQARKDTVSGAKIFEYFIILCQKYSVL